MTSDNHIAGHAVLLLPKAVQPELRTPDQIRLLDFLLKCRGGLSHNGFTNLHSDTLIRHYGSRYREKVIDPLKRDGCILVNETYRKQTSQNAGFSKSYKIPDEMLYAGIVEVPVPLIDGQVEQWAANGVNVRPGEVDKEPLCEIAHTVSQRYSMHPAWRNEAKKEYYQRHQEDPVSAAAWYANLVRCAELIERGEQWVKRDTGLRLQTAICCMPSSYRAYIRKDGKRIVTVDVKNSQPAIRASVFERWAKLSPEEIARTIEETETKNIKAGNRVRLFETQAEAREAQQEIDDRIRMHSGKTKNSRFRIQVLQEERNRIFTRQQYKEMTIRRAIEISRLLREAEAERTKYKELTEQGQIYEEIQQKIKELEGVSATRKEVKIALLTIEYERNKTEARKKSAKGVKGAVRRSYQDVFPRLYRAQELVKQISHSAWAIQIQREESRVVLTTERLSRSQTIHDCEVGAVDEAEDLRERLKADYRKEGLDVGVEIEQYKTWWERHKADCRERARTKRQTNRRNSERQGVREENRKEQPCSYRKGVYLASDGDSRSRGRCQGGSYNGCFRIGYRQSFQISICPATIRRSGCTKCHWVIGCVGIGFSRGPPSAKKGKKHVRFS